MEITKFNSENEELIDLLCSNRWPFHTQAKLDPVSIKRAIEKGYYSDGRETYWIVENEQKVGIIIIEDIEDTIPLFDLRLTDEARGKGIGQRSLKWLKNYLYGEKEKFGLKVIQEQII